MPVDISRERNPKRQQLPEEVAAYVRELIISGTVRPGDFLRMDRIAEAVGVSNTPVREGLLALRSEGFVRQMPRRGFVVAPFTPQDVLDLFWAQGELAGELAARACERITPAQLDVLAGILADYDRAVAESDDEAVARLGYMFHRQINLAADSNRLALLLHSVVRHLPNRFYAGIEGHVHATQSAHVHLVELLRAGDAEAAGRAMAEHIVSGAERLIESLGQQGMWVARLPTRLPAQTDRRDS